MYEAILNLYKHSRITKSAIAEAVRKGIITKKQYEEITGEAYPA